MNKVIRLLLLSSVIASSVCGCATLFNNAGQNSKVRIFAPDREWIRVFDEQNQEIALRSDGSPTSKYILLPRTKNHKLTVWSEYAQEKTLELQPITGIHWVLLDIPLIFPLIVDAVTQNWIVFDDVHLPLNGTDWKLLTQEKLLADRLSGNKDWVKHSYDYSKYSKHL
jgi:hypothetical protein